MKDIKTACILGTLMIIFRAIFSIFIKYYHNIDSYAYLLVAKTGIMRDNTMLSIFAAYFGEFGTNIILTCFVSFTIVIFYFMCRQFFSYNHSIIVTLMFMFSPFVFFNVQWGVFDKNVYSLFMIVNIFYSMLENRTAIRLSFEMVLLFVFSMMWQGWVIMGVFVMLMEIFRGIKWYSIRFWDLQKVKV